MRRSISSRRAFGIQILGLPVKLIRVSYQLLDLKATALQFVKTMENNSEKQLRGSGSREIRKCIRNYKKQMKSLEYSRLRSLVPSTASRPRVSKVRACYINAMGPQKNSKRSLRFFLVHFRSKSSKKQSNTSLTFKTPSMRDLRKVSAASKMFWTVMNLSAHFNLGYYSFSNRQHQRGHPAHGE